MYLSLILIAISLIVAMYVWNKNDVKNMLSLKLSGVAENVHYDDAKGAPHFTIQRRNVFLSPVYWHVYFRIQNGDSIVKQSGSMNIKVIKKITGEIIIIDGNKGRANKWLVPK